MADYFYGLEGLVSAIQSASSNQISRSISHSMVINAYNTGGDLAVRELATQYGINYTGIPLAYGHFAEGWTVTGEVVNTGLSPFMQHALSQNALECTLDTATDKLTFEALKQTTTQGATKTLIGGGVKTLTNALSVAGAVATGVQLGWESYKEHPDFWTDFSEAVFDSDNPDTPVEVLARAHSGGYTTAIKEENLCRIVQGLAEKGCFDSREYTSLVEHTGTQEITWTEPPAISKSSELGIAYVRNHYPNATILQVESDYVGDGGAELTGSVYFKENPPSSGDIATHEDVKGNDVYYVGVPCSSVLVIYDTINERAYYNEYSVNYGINSGQFYKNVTDQDYYAVGGCNVNIDVVLADNELFTNDHSPSNLQISPTSSISEIAQAIKDKFPDWYDDSWTQPEYNPETGTVEDERYYPVTIPWWNPLEETAKDPDYRPDSARSGEIKQEPDPNAKTQGETATQNNTKYETDPELSPDVPVAPPTDTPPDTGAGSGGSASGLWAVYNPTINELNDLGAYLWTNNIIELLEKFLQNPMDAIITLHRLYATPTTGSPQSIMLGYLNSGVTAKVVTNQFVTIDCGTVDIPEYFEDARDYSAPYTLTECYLPFVGIVRFRTEDIIGSSVNIVYVVDVYSGACLCKVFVTKLGSKQMLYTYSGNCSIQIPLTGSDRTRLLSGALTGAVGGGAVGGAVGAVAGAVAGAFKGGMSIDHCGGFSSNAGCMGIKKPYIILTRKYSYDAGNYNKFYGFPSNNTLSLSACKGFTRVKSVHIESIGVATDNEKLEIETLLKQGVIIK